MHELSIAFSLVEAATEAARRADAGPVREVHIAVGALAGVEGGALAFSYDIATRDTPLAGSRLVIRDLPVVLHCAPCAEDFVLPGIRSFRCPRCETPSADLRQGRELEIESLIVEVR